MEIFEKTQDQGPACGRVSSGRKEADLNEGSAPRLVINDAISATKVLVAKTRSEIRGLDAILRNLTSSPLKSK